MKKTLAWNCLFLCWMLAAVPLSATAQSPAPQTPDAAQSRYNKGELEKFSGRLEHWHQQRKFNGTVLIAIDGEIVFEKMVGYCDVENSNPLSIVSSFRLASVSKQFTAMGIMLLHQDGILNYDDKIQKHLPELPYSEVTIRHLLNHTGGLPDYMGLFSKHWEPEKPFAEKKMAVNKDAVELFAKHKPDPSFPPGEKWEYSNTGYVLLGSIIERVSGVSPQDFLKQRIFEPLNMQDSRAFDIDDQFKLNSRVYGFLYKFDGKTQLANDWHFLNGMIGDGGVYASARDLLKWDQALYGESLVKKPLLDEAFTPGKLNDGSKTDYGFGWLISKSPNGNLQVSHGGGWVGFRTYIFREPKSKLTYIVLSNCSTGILSDVIEQLKKLGQNDDQKNALPAK